MNLIVIFSVTLIMTMLMGLTIMYVHYNQTEKKVSVYEFLKVEKDAIAQKIEGEQQEPVNAELPNAEAGVIQMPQAQEGQVSLLFAGDVLLDDEYAIMSTYKQNGRILENAFTSNLIQEMQAADIFMVNNEFPYTTRGTPTEGKTYTFRADPDTVTILDDMGVDIVSLANNHAYDFGEVSLTDSLDTLQQDGMPFVGAGRNLDEAARPVYFKVGNKKIAYIAATQIEKNPTPNTKGATDKNPGVFRCNDPERLVSVIQEAKQNSDFVVLYIHWGTESTTVLDDLQKKQAPVYAQAGADIIIGDHAHCLQEVGYVENVPVIYSLGNFWFNSKSQDSCMIKVILNDDGSMQWQFIPCLQSNCKEQLLEGSEKDRVISYMRSISSGVTISPEGYITQN